VICRMQLAFVYVTVKYLIHVPEEKQ
jgi:hypothetical protein